MKALLVKILFFIVCLFLGSALAQQKNSYCFRFTWMGPSFNNESYANLNESSSCEETYPGACRDPMLITEDGSPPDYEKIWKTFPHDQISCRLSSGFVCAKWTSYFEDAVEYTMHLCTKITVEGEAPMTSGCITSTSNSSRRIELCACRSYPGSGNKLPQPCNSAPFMDHPVILLAITFFLFVIIHHIL